MILIGLYEAINLCLSAIGKWSAHGVPIRYFWQRKQNQDHDQGWNELVNYN